MEKMKLPLMLKFISKKQKTKYNNGQEEKKGIIIRSHQILDFDNK